MFFKIHKFATVLCIVFTVSYAETLRAAEFDYSRVQLQSDAQISADEKQFLSQSYPDEFDRLFRAASDQNDAASQYAIAKMFLNFRNRKGLRRETRAAIAASWILKAAKQGHVKANEQLLNMIKTGFGVVKDDDLARDFEKYAYELAHGEPDPRFTLPSKNYCVEPPEGKPTNNGLRGYFRKTYSWQFNAFLDKYVEVQINNGNKNATQFNVTMGVVIAKYKELNPCALLHGLSAAKMSDGILEGRLPILRDALPAKLLKRYDDLVAKGDREKAALEIGLYLSDHDNFRAYDMAVRYLAETSDANKQIKRADMLRRAKPLIIKALFEKRLAPTCDDYRKAFNAAQFGSNEAVIVVKKYNNLCEFSVGRGVLGMLQFSIGEINAEDCSEGECLVSYQVLCGGNNLAMIAQCMDLNFQTERARFNFVSGKPEFIELTK